MPFNLLLMRMFALNTDASRSYQVNKSSLALLTLLPHTQLVNKARKHVSNGTWGKVRNTLNPE